MKHTLSILILALATASVSATEELESKHVESYKKPIMTKGQSSANINVSMSKALVTKEGASASISRRSNEKLGELNKRAVNIQMKGIKTRPLSPKKATKVDGFNFYSASASLNYDLDNDGYYSDFTVEFEASYDYGYANIFAVLHYSKNGGPWIEYFETEVFEIYLDNSSNKYQVTSRLVTDFPTSDYDILIDLYEFGVEGIVATISSEDTQNLLALPLEDEEHELNSNASQITYVASTISHDDDGDDFFTDLTLEYDISTVYFGDFVYAEVVLTNSDELWSQKLITDNFVLGNQTEFIDLVLNSGYPAGWYDVQINVINLFTGEIIANAAQDFSSLAALKLESVDNDNHYDTPSTGGGGAISGYFMFLFFLILLYVRDIKNYSQKTLSLKVKKRV